MTSTQAQWRGEGEGVAGGAHCERVTATKSSIVWAAMMGKVPCSSAAGRARPSAIASAKFEAASEPRAGRESRESSQAREQSIT